MKLLVAGGTGVIGRPLMARLRAAGHEALSLGRKAADVRADALDAAAVEAAVMQVRPDVVVHQLTAIPARMNPRKIDAEYELTNRLRTEGTKNLIEAARKAGVRRFVAQSVCFLAEPRADGMPALELEPVWAGSPAPKVCGALNELERLVREAGAGGQPGSAGPSAIFEQWLVCRYGMFWGPGTVWDRDGAMTVGLAKRKLPIVGKGGARWSLVHVEDAAAATVALIESGASGVFQIAEEVAPTSADALLQAAAKLGAKRPWKVPRWVGRLGAGRFGVYLMTALRPASTEAIKARGWRPAKSFMRDFPDWS